MPIEMPRGLPFSVDTWTPSSKKKRYHFLTHGHKDHCQGISTHFSYPIYSTRLTKTLVLQYYPQLDDSLFVDIEVGQTLMMDDLDGCFSVTAFDANHCPGAVMFLFEGNFGNILHTGDCRLTPECLQNLPEKYTGRKGKEPRCCLDYVFLDCTFGKFSMKMPSKYSAVRQVINCIWKHPDAQVVYLTCDLLGQEEILVHVSKTFGSKIYVNKDDNPECYRALTLTAPEILCEDPSSRFQVLEGFPRLYERAQAKLAEAQTKFQPEPLIIRASAQWYACDDESLDTERQKTERSSQAVRDQFGVWHICYSMHSSRDELEWALQLLAPKWVVSTTPPCRAMDLDYVKKHCFGMCPGSDDALWRLVDIRQESSSTSDVSNVGLLDVRLEASATSNVQCCSSTVKESAVQSAAETLMQPVKTSSIRKQLFTPSPPCKRPTLTLFGRARLGAPDIPFPHEEKEVIPSKYEPPCCISDKEEQHFSSTNDGFDLRHEKSVENKADIIAVQCGMSTKEDTKSEAECEKPSENEVDVAQVQDGNLSVESKRDTSEIKWERSVEKDNKVSSSANSPIGAPMTFNETFRKLYRSMNVPVPQPLPSLVELMKANKRAKRSFQF